MAAICYSMARMRVFSFDPAEPGIIAVGQISTGIIAFGQFATGVVAIGQAARGVVAVGQGALGVVAVGQAAVGLWFAGGAQFAVGLWCRQMWHGDGISLLPSWVRRTFPEPAPPTLSTLRELMVTKEEGWIEVQLSHDALYYDGKPFDFEAGPKVEKAVAAAIAQGHNTAYAHVQSERVFGEAQGYRELVDSDTRARLLQLRSFERRSPELVMTTSPTGLALRLLGFVALCIGYWFLAGRSITAMFW